MRDDRISEPSCLKNRQVVQQVLFDHPAVNRRQMTRIELRTSIEEITIIIDRHEPFFLIVDG